MTTATLQRLNRDITILYRHLCGEPNSGIANHYGLHRESVRRLIGTLKNNQRVVQAAQMMRTEREKE